MRKLEYLSPTSVSTWLRDRHEFYRRYLCDVRVPQDPQTIPMAIGVVFDALVKDKLARDVFGSLMPEHLMFEALIGSGLNESLGEGGREAAVAIGQGVFKNYVNFGCYQSLLETVSKSRTGPMFEFSAFGGPVGTAGSSGSGSTTAGSGSTTAGSGKTIVKGKPDLAYTSPEGKLVILDWKCNGFAGTAKISPKPNFYEVWGNLSGREKLVLRSQSRIEDDWYRQVSMYAYALGIGDGVGRIEQLCGPLGSMRVARFEDQLSGDRFQSALATVQEIWDICNSGWIFRDLTEEQSVELCSRYDRADVAAYSDYRKLTS